MRRASSLYFAGKCGHASYLSGIHPETSTLAGKGQDTHAEIARGIVGEKEPSSDAAKAAVKWVREIVESLKSSEPILRVENAVTLLDNEEHDFDILVPGHPDLLIGTPEILHVVDWKKSKWGDVPEPDKNPQLISYGLAECIGRPFQVHLVFGDDSDENGNVQPRSSHVFMPDEHPALLAWIRELATKGTDPCVGGHCSSCYVSQYCEAYRSRMTSVLAVIDRSEGDMVQDAAQLLDEKMRFAEQWLEWAKQVRKDYVKMGGVLFRDGKQAHIVPTKGRETADCKKLRADGLTKYIHTGDPSDMITWRKFRPSLEPVPTTELVESSTK
jgi:hypothetical protein